MPTRQCYYIYFHLIHLIIRIFNKQTNPYHYVEHALSWHTAFFHHSLLILAYNELPCSISPSQFSPIDARLFKEILTQ